MNVIRNFQENLLLLSKPEAEVISNKSDASQNMETTQIYNGILLSHEKNEIMPFVATWIDLEIIIISEVSQRQILYDITYM